MNTEPLQKLGLDETEIKTYITLLKIGPCLAGTLSKETGINRTHNYDVLERLIERGFVSFYFEKGKKYFVASDPEVLISYIQNIDFEMKRVLPELNKLKQFKKEETNVEVYRGTQGFRTVINDLLKTKEDIYVLGEQGHFEKYAPVLLKQFLRMLKERKIKEKVIVIEGTKYEGNKQSEIRYLPKTFKSNTYIVIYGDKVRLSIWSDPPHFILIKNKDLAELYKKQFSVFWKLSKSK